MNQFGFNANFGFGMGGMPGMGGMGGMPGMNDIPGMNTTNIENEDEDEENNDNINKYNIIFVSTQGVSYNIYYNYGATIDEVLKAYLNEAETPELIDDRTNRICFLYNATRLRFGDETPIETFFRNSINPRIIVNDIENLIKYDKLLLKKSKKENDKLEKKISRLNNKVQSLSNELLNAKLAYFNQANMVKCLSDLNQEINERDNNYRKEINDLKLKLSKYEYDVEVTLHDMIVINFDFEDGTIRYAMQCLKTETFAQVEEKLYEKYREYKNTNNKFISNGRNILRFKTVEENNIRDGDTVQLQAIEDN